MKFEVKVVIMSIIFSIVCMFVFTYASSFTQKTIYAYQVGIYKEASNKQSITTLFILLTKSIVLKKMDNTMFYQ